MEIYEAIIRISTPLDNWIANVNTDINNRPIKSRYSFASPLIENMLSQNYISKIS